MVILGLGSNIGDRLANLRAAINTLAEILSNMRESSVYESKALLPEGAPKNWAMPFLNMVIIGECNLAPREILAHVKSCEEKIGRQKRGVWAPREIDIDILAIGDLVIETPELCVPHKEIANRDFVAIPLAEIAPDWRHPLLNMSSMEISTSNSFLLGENIRIFNAN